MIRLANRVFFVVAAFFGLFCNLVDGNSLPAFSNGASRFASVSPLTAEKLSGPLKEDTEANLVRMKRTTMHYKIKEGLLSEPDQLSTTNSRSMSGTGRDHHVHGPEHGLDLPPVCPRIHDHTELTFKSGTKAMDPYGLPCLLEMHWSREDAPSFDSVQCKRRYKLHGFTEWTCAGYPQLITQFIMIYHIECLDIGPEGTVLNDNFNPSLIVNPAWIPVPNVSDSNGTNLPASNFEQPGHYCYLRYAIEPNDAWHTARIITAGVALVGGFFMTTGFVSAQSCAAIVTNIFYAFAVASITGVSLFVIQFSDYLSSRALWWIPVINMGAVGLLSVCWIVPMMTDACKGSRGFRRRKRMGQSIGASYGDEEECLLDGSNREAEIHIDYDALARAMASVNQNGDDERKTGLRPRGVLKTALDILDAGTTLPLSDTKTVKDSTNINDDDDETKEC